MKQWQYILLTAIGVIVLIWLLLKRRSAAKTLRLMREGICAEATVTRVTCLSLNGKIDSDCNWVVDARFTYEGREYRAMSGLLPYKPYCEAGKTVRVHFLPENPGYNRILEGDAPPGRMALRNIVH